MPNQASTDRDLARAGGKQRTTGSRLLLVAGILFGIGLVLMSIEDKYVAAAGVALAALAAPITLAGLGLFVSGLVSGRASKQKPFA